MTVWGSRLRASPRPGTAPARPSRRAGAPRTPPPAPTSERSSSRTDSGASRPGSSGRPRSGCRRRSPGRWGWGAPSAVASGTAGAGGPCWPRPPPAHPSPPCASSGSASASGPAPGRALLPWGIRERGVTHPATHGPRCLRGQVRQRRTDRGRRGGQRSLPFPLGDRGQVPRQPLPRGSACCGGRAPGGSFEAPNADAVVKQDSFCEADPAPQGSPLEILAAPASGDGYVYRECDGFRSRAPSSSANLHFR